ncbi:Leo1-domain-containing protein [Rickenella mellea]|uniref:Leo1-domain-containing protein n=1 Tax=Rickenella mellea TaxID=50990 RepID=A0A4Y7Q7X3_9AGAM|nr:Leo1-domain-containing protein [Rickenella mellea]
MSSLASALDPPEQVVDPQLLQQLYPVGSNQPPTLKLEIPQDNDVKDEQMADLFGDEDAEVVRRDTVSPAPSAPVSEALSAAEQQHRKDLEYEEDEGGDEAVVELKHAVLSIPNVPTPQSSDGNNWVLRIPNFVKLDAKPFHHETYVGPEQFDEESQQAENIREKSMSIKLEVENTIRWKWVKDDDGQYRRQSNSRVVRWSDGSMSFLLGKELFDVTKTVDNSASVPRSIHASQPASQSQSQSTSQARSQGLTYLVAQHKRPGILQAEAPVTGYMALRPTGMQSETHRMLVRAVGQKHNKVARLRMAPDPTRDPERERMELEKADAKKAKARKEDDGNGARRRRGAASRRRTSDVWSDDEEPGAAFEGSDEDEEERFSGGRKIKAERAEADAAKKGSGEYQTDDFVVADSSDEDAEGSDSGAAKKRRSRTGGAAEVETDALDEMEAKLAAQEEDRRRKRKADAEDAGQRSGLSQDDEDQKDDAMDIESEEDEEEEAEDFKVRRAGTGSRKKRAVAIDEDDEDE